MPLHTITRRRFATAVGLSGLVFAGTGAVAGRGQNRNFRTHLSGENEVPTVETTAQGQAEFQLNKAGGVLRYKLVVANIENVLMAHIHLGTRDENGPVVVWLYPEDGPPSQLIEGRFDGVLAEDVITEEDLVGPLAGKTFDDLIAAMRAGETYVNVHTTTNPGGKIRGQIH